MMTQFAPRTSYVDLWNRVLAAPNDIREFAAHHEKCYAHDLQYRNPYRNYHACHGAHPFAVQYWSAHALDAIQGNLKTMGLAAVLTTGFSILPSPDLLFSVEGFVEIEGPVHHMDSALGAVCAHTSAFVVSLTTPRPANIVRTPKLFWLVEGRWG